MTISIALCTFNGGRFLHEQLESLIIQTRLPDEVVVCDDGSSDETRSILEAFAASAPFVVRLVQNSKNLGSTANFEQAIGLCQGELISLCDQDDIWMKDKLAVLEAEFLDDSVGGAFSDGELIDEESRSMSDTLWNAFGFDPRLRRQWREEGAVSVLMKQDIVTGAALMFRARLMSSILPIACEWIHDGWISWIAATTSRLVFVDAPLIRYRVHASQQAGIPDSTPRARLARLAGEGDTKAAQEVRKFEKLLARVDELAIDTAPTIKELLEQKVEHCRFRAALPKGRAVRLPAVLSHVQEYRRYSRGLTDAMKDVVKQ